MRGVLIVILTMMFAFVSKAEDNGKGTIDSIPHLNVNLNNPELGVIRKTVRGFSAIDTNYVEPQHYNWAFMIQNSGRVVQNRPLFRMEMDIPWDNNRAEKPWSG